MKIFLGLVVAIIFCALSYRLKWLTFRGSVTATLFGGSLIYFGDLVWITPVILFFGTSSLLSKLHRPLFQSAHAEDVRNEKQVLANGAVAWLLLLLSAVDPHHLWFVGFAGAVAAATADTWATEIGRLTRGKTRSILTGRPVPPGVSGGVSWQGTLGGLIGAGLIALVSIPGFFMDDGIYVQGRQVFSIVLGGATGSIVDSMLGASLQARYRNVQTGEVEEAGGFTSGQYIHHAGWRWMTNDVVNFFCTIAGALVAMLMWAT